MQPNHFQQTHNQIGQYLKKKNNSNSIINTCKTHDMVFLHSEPPICSLIFDISDPLTSPMKYFFLSLSIKKERTDGSIG